MTRWVSCFYSILLLITYGTQLLGDHVKTVIFSCSEYEAKNYGTIYLSVGYCCFVNSTSDDRALFVGDSHRPLEVGTRRAAVRARKPYEDRWKNCSPSRLPAALDQQGPHKHCTRRPLAVDGLQTNSTQVAQKAWKSKWCSNGCRW